MYARFIVWVILMLWGGAFPGNAHEARPLYISLKETNNGNIVAHLKFPETIPINEGPILLIPDGCMVMNGIGSIKNPQTWISPVSFRCQSGLSEKIFSIKYAAGNPAITSLIRIAWRDGSETIKILPPNELSWSFPKEQKFFDVAVSYFKLGVEHIWTGIDHLLFVAALVMLVTRINRLIWTITGFTIAHSITLALAALDIINIAIPPTEAAIALSIVFLARELADKRQDTIGKRFPIAVSFIFGLLHGFGFAAALTEIGLPKQNVASGLLFFNIGVEIGQIAFILLLLSIFSVSSYLIRKMPESYMPVISRWGYKTLAAYGLGALATFWFFQRIEILI